MPLTRNLVGWHGTGTTRQCGLPFVLRPGSQLVSRAIVTPVAGEIPLPSVVTLALSGLITSGAAGSVSLPNHYALTGNTATGAVGAISSGRLSGVAGASNILGAIIAPQHAAVLSGPAGTGATGTVVWGKATSLTGTAGTGSVGTLNDKEILVLQGGVDTATGIFGSVSAGPARALTGGTGVGSVGALARGNTSLALTGSAAVGSVNTVVRQGPANVPLAGNAGTGGVQDIQARHSAALSGNTAVTSIYNFVKLTLALSGTTSVGTVNGPIDGSGVITNLGDSVATSSGAIVVT